MTDALTRPDADALQALLERVEKAEGLDREMDEALADALNLAPDGWVKQDNGVYYLSPLAIEMEDDDKGWWSTPKYTASIDAAVALVEKMLPEWRLVLDFGSLPVAVQCSLYWHPDKAKAAAWAKTPALALCAALLRALIARDA